MDLEFNLIFKGEVALDHDFSATRQNLAKAFNASDEKIAVLFSGKPVAIKKAISSIAGIKLQRQLLSMGAVTYLEPVHSTEMSSSGRPSTSPQVQAGIAPHESVKKTSNRLPPVTPTLALQPIEEPNNFGEQQAPQDEDVVQEKVSFSFPAVGFSLGLVVALFLTFLGVICLLVFSPYPDLIVRKGFALGAILIFFGIRKLRK